MDGTLSSTFVLYIYEAIKTIIVARYTKVQISFLNCRRFLWSWRLGPLHIRHIWSILKRRFASIKVCLLPIHIGYIQSDQMVELEVAKFSIIIAQNGGLVDKLVKLHFSTKLQNIWASFVGKIVATTFRKLPSQLTLVKYIKYRPIF